MLYFHKKSCILKWSYGRLYSSIPDTRNSTQSLFLSWKHNLQDSFLRTLKGFALLLPVYPLLLFFSRKRAFPWQHQHLFHLPPKTNLVSPPSISPMNVYRLYSRANPIPIITNSHAASAIPPPPHTSP